MFYDDTKVAPINQGANHGLNHLGLQALNTYQSAHSPASSANNYRNNNNHSNRWFMTKRELSRMLSSPSTGGSRSRSSPRAMRGG